MKKVSAASLEGTNLPESENKEMKARLKVAEEKMLYT
jgi:hypothetical protein